MVRTADEQRPVELLDAIVGYLTTHGVAELSLRPLAKAVGSSPRVLLYYFGSKEKLLEALFNYRAAGASSKVQAILGNTELNPMENVWDYLRGNRLSHLVWDSYEAMVSACAKAWRFLIDDPDRIRSIAHRHWATVNG